MVASSTPRTTQKVKLTTSVGAGKVDFVDLLTVLLIIEIHEIHMVNAEIHEIQHKYEIHQNCKLQQFSQFPYPVFKLTLGLIIEIHEIHSTKNRNPRNPPKSTNTKFTPYTRPIGLTGCIEYFTKFIVRPSDKQSKQIKYIPMCTLHEFHNHYTVGP